jgi:hypothetical protein
MTRDYMAIERAREAGQQPDYEDTKDCGCRECFLENEVERLTAERDAAYGRGAEAMREAIIAMLRGWHYTADMIRAVPAPSEGAKPAE